MGFTNCPLEVIEMIIGKVCFVDLLYLLQTSRTIRDAFAASKYHAKYQFIPDDSRRIIQLNMLDYPVMWPEWTVERVLNTYTDPYCENCEDFGYMFLWAAIPPKKVCAYCLASEPLYGHYDLPRTLKFATLVIADVASYPIFLEEIDYVTDKVKLPSRILGESICNIATAKGMDSDLVYTIEVALRCRNQRFMDGFLKVSGMFDPKLKSHVKSEVICGHCPAYRRSDPESDYGLHFYEEVYKNQTFVRNVVFCYVPRTYESLHYHVSIFHPDLLDSFERGWQSLTPSLKSNWLSHVPGVGDEHGSQIWVSWTHSAYLMILSGDRRPRCTSLKDYLADRITHEGELFGIPREIDFIGLPGLFGDEFDEDEGLKRFIADRFSNYFQRRIQEECEQWLKNVVESGGVGTLKPLLEADSVLKLIANSMGSQYIAENEVEM